MSFMRGTVLKGSMRHRMLALLNDNAAGLTVAQISKQLGIKLKTAQDMRYQLWKIGYVDKADDDREGYNVWLISVGGMRALRNVVPSPYEANNIDAAIKHPTPSSLSKPAKKKLAILNVLKESAHPMKDTEIAAATKLPIHDIRKYRLELMADGYVLKHGDVGGGHRCKPTYLWVHTDNLTKFANASGVSQRVSGTPSLTIPCVNGVQKRSVIDEIVSMSSVLGRYKNVASLVFGLDDLKATHESLKALVDNINESPKRLSLDDLEQIAIGSH